MEVVFPLHHLLNQEFPVGKKQEVWIHNTTRFQFLSLPPHQWSEGASSCQLWVPATLGEGSSSQGFIQLPKSFPVWMRGHDLSDSIGSCTERGSSTPFCRCNELPALAFPQLSKLLQTQNTSPTGRKNSIWIKILRSMALYGLQSSGKKGEHFPSRINTAVFCARRALRSRT